jgi:hypothetical protein
VVRIDLSTVPTIVFTTVFLIGAANGSRQRNASEKKFQARECHNDNPGFSAS